MDVDLSHRKKGGGICIILNILYTTYLSKTDFYDKHFMAFTAFYKTKQKLLATQFTA